jgi:ATP-binding cassette, subfamily F, member 3
MEAVMSILKTSQLHKAFGSDDIFDDIHVDIPHGAKIALVGPNGAGKTTLVRILVGLDDPSGGSVIRMRGLRIGYLPQRPELVGDHALWDEMLKAFSELRVHEANLETLGHQLADSPDDAAVLEAYGEAQHAFEQAGGYTYETRIRQVLQGLSFSADDYQKSLAILSGGQRTRALLARLLLEAPDLLVMDEPTNHLDIEAVEWLEGFLNSWPGALLVVSHDRYFMDRVVSTIWELDWGQVDAYRGNYSHYVQQREERRAFQLSEFESQQEMIAKEEDYIRRNMAGQNTKQAKGRLKRLDRFKAEKLVARPRDNTKMRLRFSANTRSGDKVLMTKDLRVGYSADKPLVTVPDLTLYRGDTAAIIGPNGVGKSTLLKTMLGQLEALQGWSKLGAQVKIGYFAQAHEKLTPTNTIMEELLSVRNFPISQARDYLANFLFTGDDVFRQVSTLSGGERGRLALAKLALDGANFLLLDEPTNHLDIDSQEILQGMISNFDGTVLLVSHDRYLINALATQIWAIAPGSLEAFEMPYQEYLTVRDKRAAAAKEAAREKELAKTKLAAKAASTDKDKGKQSAFQREKRLADVEKNIAGLEQKMAEIAAGLEQASTAGAVDKVRTLGAEYEAVRADIEAQMAEWETLSLA